MIGLRALITYPKFYPTLHLESPTIVLIFIPVLSQAIQLGRTEIERARTLEGKIVVASFLIAKPSVTVRGFYSP